MPDDAPLLSLPNTEAAVAALLNTYDGLQQSLEMINALGPPPPDPEERQKHADRAMGVVVSAQLSLAMKLGELAFCVRHHFHSKLN